MFAIAVLKNKFIRCTYHVKNESEHRLYAIGMVESKDYCYAKKNGNRHHMVHGSRFYRVREKSLKPHLQYPACRQKQDTQKSLDTSRSTISNTDEATRVEVATGTLMNLESPVSSSNAPALPNEFDSIQLESSAHLHVSRMQLCKVLPRVL